jgi:hypothetical protein
MTALMPRTVFNVELWRSRNASTAHALSSQQSAIPKFYLANRLGRYLQRGSFLLECLAVV